MIKDFFSSMPRWEKIFLIIAVSILIFCNFAVSAYAVPFDGFFPDSIDSSDVLDGVSDIIDSISEVEEQADLSSIAEDVHSILLFLDPTQDPDYIPPVEDDSGLLSALEDIFSPSSDDYTPAPVVGVKSVVLDILGDYSPITDSSGAVISGSAGVDWSWVCLGIFFLIVIFCLFRLLGVIIRVI